MRAITLKIGAGKSEDVAVSGDYVRVKTAGVSVRIEAGLGAVDATVEQGDALNLKPFESLKISHASGVDQTVTLLIGNGTSSDSAKVGGSVDVTSLPANGISINQISTPTIIPISTTILAENPARKFLLLQNNEAATIVYLGIGVAAVIGVGVKLAPGASLLLDKWVPKGQINAISDAVISNNTLFAVLEG